GGEDSRWESGFQVEIPEFHGSVESGNFVDWWATVKSILAFKAVPEDRRVRLLRLVFSTRSVDDYTHEFYQLLTRVEVRETKSQLISCYISGLRVTIQDMLNLVLPETVFYAYQRARLVEQQLARKMGSPFPSSTRVEPATGGPQQSSRFTPSAAVSTGHTTAPGHFPLTGTGNQQQSGMGGLPPAATGQHPGGGLRCFGCGELCHRQSACPRGSTSRGLFLEDGGEQEVHTDYDGPPVFDVEPGLSEEHHSGDVDSTLVVRRVCLTPHSPVDEPVERHQIFESTCTIGDKVCRFIIDLGSSKNVISHDSLTILGLLSDPHPHPYKLAWIHHDRAITID
ncbi:F-box associated ubiquitination effector family protein, partial [Striga hermonthica]